MSRVFCLGELLIDMAGTDNKNLKEGKTFVKNAGGAPANVCASVATLGGEAFFMGQVGNDSFGDYLVEKLQSLNIDTSMVVHGGNTSMAFVSIDEDGERDFTFLRDSDGNYDFRNIKTNMITKNDICHFGSATGLLNGTTLKKTYMNFLYFAKEHHAFRTFDPNYRDTLLPDSELDRYKKDCITFISKSHVVKMSVEELHILTDCDDYVEGARIIHELGAPVVIVTLGEKGSYIQVREDTALIPTIKVNQVDSTGAGDAFMGAILYQLSKIDDKRNVSFESWKEILRFANVVGGLVTTKYGAMEGLPTCNEVQQNLNK